MGKQIYRQEALERLASPDRLDQLMPLTDRRAWLALAAAGLLAAVALAWGVFGSIAITVEGEGVLTRSGGLSSLAAPADGVYRFAAQPGDDVKRGQTLATLDLSSGKKQTLVSPIDGRLLNLLVKSGDRVTAGSELGKLESLEHPLKAILFVATADAFRVRPGLEVRVTLGAEKSARMPGLVGTVESVARFPATRLQMLQVLQSEEWVGLLSRGGPFVEVVVSLGDSPGDQAHVYSSTPCRAEITIDRQRPIEFVFPVPSR
jgi:hypothetical protein